MKDRKFQDIKLFVCDFDGIFTDGKLTVYSDGLTSKIIDYKDVMAIANILKAGVKFAVISGETSKAIDIIKEKFPSAETFQNIRNKLEVLKGLVSKYNLQPENVLYAGDDINDAECLKYAGAAFTVNDPHKSIKEIEGIYITERNGGQGAVREIADLIL